MYLDYNDLANEYAGNWKKFDSFSWHNMGINDPENCAIFNISTRDSSLLELSNHDEIIKAMEESNDSDNWWLECHSHWAVGYANALIIRVYDDNNNITNAFKAYCDILESLDNYPVLNEDDYYERVYNQNYDMIKYELSRLIHNDIDDDELELFTSHIMQTMDNSGFYNDDDLYLDKDDILKIIQKNNLPLIIGSYVGLYNDYDDIEVYQVENIIAKDTLFENFKIVTLQLDNDMIATIEYNTDKSELNDHCIVFYNPEN